MLNHFVTRGMFAKCDQGSKSNYLNTLQGHGCFYKGQPILNANDHDAKWCFPGFGDCKCLKEKAMEKEEERLENSNLLIKVPMLRKDLSFNNCRPDTPYPWEQCNEEVLLEGAPVLMQGSFCTCVHGGIITVEEIKVEKKQDVTISPL